MKILLTVLLFSTLGLANANASFKAPQKTATTAFIQWSDVRFKLIDLAEQFRDDRISKKEKEKLLPATNEYLSYMQDLNFTATQDQERVQLVVDLLAATLEFDFASSNADTVYFDYKENKELYDRAIQFLADQKVARELMDTFRSLSEAETKR